jgi:hypothetical protein
MIGSKFDFSCTRSARSEAFIATRTRPSDSAAWGMLSKSTSLFCLASQLTCVPHVSAAIANNDPPMQYSICIWGEARVWTWGARVVCERSACHWCTMLKRANIGSLLAHARGFEVRGVAARLWPTL